MHSILVTFQSPSDDREDTMRRWRELLSDISGLTRHNENAETLSETVLLIRLDRGLSSWVKVSSRLDREGTPYKVLFFDEEPKWVSSS